jgi:hypothetical protein
MKNLLACLLVATMSGCPDVTVDPDEVDGGPVVEFDPARSQALKARFIPSPNDLARDPMTGKVALGEQNCESATSKAIRENVLNKLDGFGTYQTAMQVTFTEPVDEATLAGNVVMVQLAENGMLLAMPAMVPVVVARVGKSPRFEGPGMCADTDAKLVDAVTFVPGAPLKQRSTYFVALVKGIKSMTGADFTGSYTWGLVASAESPVTLDEAGNIVSDRTPLDPADEAQRAQLISLAGLWKLHDPGLKAIAATGKARADVLVGFQFTTQTVTDPLDPMVTTSPASKLANVGVLGTMSVTNRFGALGTLLCGAEATTAPTQCFLKLALGGCAPLTTGCGMNNYTAGTAACQLVNCAGIGDVLGGGVVNVNYQAQNPNMFDAAKPLQGAWSDPVNPADQGSITLETLIAMPAGTAPSTGWPVVLFGHGLGSSKESALAIAGRLASAGFATVAIDTAAHGSRAVRISNDINLGCTGMCFSGTTPTGTQCETIAQCQSGQTCGSLAATPSLVPPSPTTAAQCYAPFLSPDLGMTRDGIRQTILDHQRVIRALKTCGAAGCNLISVDPNRIFYAGISLGSILGGMTTAMTPDIDAALLNVGGAGWADILENTETLAIRCSLVNGLIDAGILKGEKWAGGTTGLCTTPEWKMQPGYATFAAIGRWVLDPADPANYGSRLATKKVLIQEVVGDTVVPNVSTDRLAAVSGLAANPLAGDPFNGMPSAAITMMPTTSKFVRYTSDATNVFVHSSLLRPAPTTDPQHGINGTLRLVVDGVRFLAQNNQ